MQKYIYLDMDGTIADLYANPKWLEYLNAYDTTPYATAKPLVNMQVLARTLNRLQAQGYKIGIISWCSKTTTADYDERVIKVKHKWLKTHLRSVQFDEIHIVAYGTAKSTLSSAEGALLFDDEQRNRTEWANIGTAYSEKNILEILKKLLTK